MTGTLAQLISLVSFGNDFLNTGTLPGNFYPENSTFQFCNSVEFVAFKKSLFSSKFKESTIASDPYKWFELLKKDKCKRLSLFYQPSDQSMGPDHKLAGFVGGGGGWLIEAVHNKHSDFWANNWTVTNKDAADRKIWSVKYGAIAWDQPTQNLQFDLDAVREELHNALLNISLFANEHQLNNWLGVFEKARKALNSDNPAADFYHKDLIVTQNYPLPARQLLFCAGLAWVFGGMGSWNDLVFDKPEDNKAYDELSTALYSAINTAIMSVINAAFDSE
jgi:hypothetical protein